MYSERFFTVMAVRAYILQYMQITMFGASGKVGRLVVPMLLKDGHVVTVFVHKTIRFNEHPNLTVAKGDVHDARAVEHAVKNADIVISTLGSWGAPTKDVLSAATRFMLPALKPQAKVITLTGSAACTTHEQLTLLESLSRRFLQLVASDIVRDADEHLRLLQQSKANWTSVRSPAMKNGSQSTYRFVHKAPAIWVRVNRSAVAQALVDLVSADSYSREAPHIR